MEESFAKSVIEDMIRQYGTVSDIVKDFNGYDLWVLDNGVTIRLPADNSRIPEVVVNVIAEVKLEISTWEYDYWLGQR